MGFFRKILDAMHADYDPVGAKRLAYLLIAEIKLYQPHKLRRGKDSNDILGELNIEISSARNRFLEVHPQDEAAKIFDELLLEMLADGDPTKMGKSPQIGLSVS